MDDIINTSDFQTSFDELQRIEEVVSATSDTNNGVCSNSSLKEEALRSSILEEFFPEESMETDTNSSESNGNDIERNNQLIAEVEHYLTSVTGLCMNDECVSVCSIVLFTTVCVLY